MINILFKGIIIGLTISAPVGPTSLFCIKKTIQKGIVPGLLAGLGAALADLTLASLVILNLDNINKILLKYENLFVIVNSVILIILGVYIYKKSTVKKIKLQQKINRTKEFNSIFVTFLMIITNPLSIILYTVILSTTYLNNAQTENYFKLLPAISILVGDMIWWACFLLVIHYFRAKINYKYFQLIDKIVSIAIIIFGIVNVRLIV